MTITIDSTTSVTKIYEQHAKHCKNSGGEYQSSSDRCKCPSGKQTDGKEGIFCVTPETFKQNCTNAGGQVSRSGECKCKNNFQEYQDGYCIAAYMKFNQANKCPRGFTALSRPPAIHCSPDNEKTCNEFGGTWGQSGNRVEYRCLCGTKDWDYDDKCATKTNADISI